MNIRNIMTKAIKKAGGDGLCNPRAKCGCGLDNLFICEMFDIDECVIAKKTPCKNCSIVDDYCYMPIEPKEYAYNYNQFLNIEHADDWLVHEIPKVGEWYKRGYNYYQCSSVHKHEEGTHVYLRKAGDKVSRHMTKSYGELVPASLTPNFKDAKIGDKCFSIIDGPSEITQLSTDSRPLPVGYLSVSGADRVCCNNGFELGRKMYPTLFHSAKQAVAYFAEVALKEENDG